MAIMYACEAGKTARYRSEEKYSHYTGVLIEELTHKVDIVQVARKVAFKVSAKTGFTQKPQYLETIKSDSHNSYTF